MATSLVKEGIGEIMSIILSVVFVALVVGTLLVQTVFTDLTIINVTNLTTTFGSFLTAITAFFVIAGTFLGIGIMVKYALPLFKGKDGLSNISA